MRSLLPLLSHLRTCLLTLHWVVLTLLALPAMQMVGASVGVYNDTVEAAHAQFKERIYCLYYIVGKEYFVDPE